VNAVKSTIGITPSPDDTNRLIRLAVQVQPYGYGKVVSNSLAARLVVATLENKFKIDESPPYGEVIGVLYEPLMVLQLWMGDHQNGSSRSAVTGMGLHNLIKTSPEEFLREEVLS
jgi:hypothetical protein